MIAKYRNFKGNKTVTGRVQSNRARTTTGIREIILKVTRRL